MNLRRLAAGVALLAGIGTASCGDEAIRPPVVGDTVIPAFYTSQPIHGTVVDARTQEPVAGAVVVAVWRQVNMFFHHWAGIFRRVEVETDGMGRFTIPRWGPRPRPLDAYLDKRDPELWVIRRGYLVGYFDNEGSNHPRAGLRPSAQPAGAIDVTFVKMPPGKMPHRIHGEYVRAADGGSFWNGRTLRLEHAPSSIELAESIAGASPFDPWLEGPRDPVPMFWREWHAIHDALDATVKARFTEPKSTIDIVIVRAAPKSPAR